MKKTILKTCYYGITLFLLFLALFACVNKTLWVDEVYSLELANHPMFELIYIDSLDVHPPLYYVLLRLALLILRPFGLKDIYIGKIASFVPYLILVILGFTKIKKQYGYVTSFLFNIFILSMPHMPTYASEIRMYSWGMLFVTCAFFQLPNIISNNAKASNYIKLTIFSSLASYTHYFSCASAVIIYLELFIILLIKKESKKNV